MAYDKVTGLTVKQEKFCRQYVGPCKGNGSAAYRSVYNVKKMSVDAVGGEAWKLLAHPHVSRMIDRLRDEQKAQEAITVEEISAALRRAVDGAAAAEQWGASSQAALGLAKLAGLLVEKRQITADPGAEHLDAVATLAGVPRRQGADRDDGNVVELKQAACVDSASKGS